MVSTVLAPREESAVTETVEVGICEDTILTTIIDVILNEPSNRITCTETAEYECKLENICEVYLGINFETVYGTPIDYNNTPFSVTTDDHAVYVKYIYTVTNVGPPTENINSLSRTLNGNVKDLTSDLDTTELVPRDDVVSS